MIKRYFYRKRLLNLGQSGFTHSTFIIILLLIISTVSIVRFVGNHAAADGPSIRSGINGYCMDVHNDKTANNTEVYNWKCNDSSAQVWNINEFNIVHDSKYCLTVNDNNLKAVLSTCNNLPEQVWLLKNGGYFNPYTQLCLLSNKTKLESQLSLGSCNYLTTAQAGWNPTSSFKNDQCSGSKGNVIACNTAKQWIAWKSTNSSHENLLNTYTNGASYEEWCADFVSYIYKQSGYPFIKGESNGWDENDANNIQYMGFTKHLATDNYIAKPGDVGYFDYNGGHVEIVISGGSKPTFIYGNSANIDKTTGNGEMEANTITHDGSNGKLLYYLSPN